ncbi:MAG TPA: hypothetical protein VLA92_03725 [Candidatus Saccharimonadales bacterium]|nr:hypothetical protein [Candidatus Saccharimonadales bacterium]
MSNQYPERPAQDQGLPPEDMWAGETYLSYNPYEQHGDPYAQQQYQPQYPIAPAAVSGYPEAAALPADVPPVPGFEPTPTPQGPTPEEEALSRADWTDLLGLAHFASEQAASTYTERKEKAKGLEVSDQYDDDGKLTSRAPEYDDLLKVTPDILLVQPTRFRLSAENLKTAWQERRYGRIGRMLLPHCVEEVPVMSAWTVVRTEVEATPQTDAASEAAAVLTAAQRYAQKHRKVSEGEETAPTAPVEGPKEIERIAVTNKGELIRLTGSDDALKETGKPLRIVIRNEIPASADDAGDDEKAKVEKLKADEEVVAGYLKDNAEAFTSTMDFEEEMDAASRSRASREHIREGLFALLAKAGIDKATD